MRIADIYESEGVTGFRRQANRPEFRSQDLASVLEEEVRAASNPVVSSWLQFYVGYSQWLTDRLDAAASTFEDIARRGRPAFFAQLAHLVAARVHLARRDLPAQIRMYEELLAAFPGFTLDYRRCRESAVILFDGLCSGAASIPGRLSAIRTLLTARAAAENVIGDPQASVQQKAAAWLELGQAWEAKDEIDPGPSDRPEHSEEAARAYEEAVRTAPGLAPAGRAAWRLIAFSKPYEWEGDVDAQVAWMFEKYGGFLAAYPGHELAGEALFKTGVASWAAAGYPELFGLIEVSGTWNDWKAQKAYLDQWFDTGGFGGGTGTTPPTRHPEETRKALAIFRDVVVRYPGTASSTMARYYAAVILDYCLNDVGNALREYDTFLKGALPDDVYVDRAKNRIAALSAAR